MSEQKSGAATAADKAGSLWGELGPTLAFIVIYNVLLRLPSETALFNQDTALYWATGALMIGTGAIVAYKFAKKQKIPPFLLISSAVIGIFGTIGIVWQSKEFLFIKPTIVSLIFASVIFGGLAVGRNIWKMLFESVFDLPDFAWRTLAVRWGLYFIAMAIWNIVLWQFFSEETWANWRLGNLALGVLFALANTPYTLKHLQSDDKPAPAE